MRLRACWILLTDWTKFFACRRVTSFQQRKEVTKKRRPGVCAGPSQKKKRDGPVPCAPQPERGPATGHPWPDAGRFGILPRPAPNRRRLVPPRAVVLGADNGEENQKPKRTATAQSHIKSHSSFPRKRESRSRRDALRDLTPPP